MAHMVIQYLGEECFKLQSGEISILVNPTNNRLKADVVLKTLSSADALPETGEVIFGGEYEIKGIEIRGWGVEAESTDKFVKTVYAVDWEDMRFVFLGHLSKPLDPDIVESLGEPDFLFVPTGDSHFLDPDEAAKLAKQLEPAIIIPSFRKDAKEFLKAMGAKGDPQEKLVLKKKDVVGKKAEVVVLEAK